MPLLSAIDEYDSAVTKITAQVQIALESEDPAYHHAALYFIATICEHVDDEVTGLLANADFAAYLQLQASVLCNDFN